MGQKRKALRSFGSLSACGVQVRLFAGHTRQAGCITADNSPLGHFCMVAEAACAPVCILFPLYLTLSSAVQGRWARWKMVQHHFFVSHEFLCCCAINLEEYTLQLATRLVLKEMKNSKKCKEAAHITRTWKLYVPSHLLHKQMRLLQLRLTLRYYDWSAARVSFVYFCNYRFLFIDACTEIKLNLICCVCNIYR